MKLRYNHDFSDRGASESIGAVMLISVVVLAVAIIGVFLTSQGTPQNIPAVNAIISENGKTVQLYHDGGDSLQKREMVILVDGINKISNFVDASGSDAWQSWSFGESLVYTAPSETPKTVTVVYQNPGSGANAVLSSANFGAMGQYTIGPTGPITSQPTPTPGPRTIAASAGAGGSIAPSGSVSVLYGSSRSFTITPDAGYHVADVLVDGSSVGAVTSYSFTNVVADHTISASFASSSYTITASAGTGGSISPSGSVSVAHGNSQAFTITANSGYYISAVTVDGVSQGSVTSYTFTNVMASHTIAAVFATDPVITSSAGTGGTISPLGAVSVPYGGSQTFTIVEGDGYYLSDVLVDGISIGAITGYTFTNVVTSHTIAATFAADPVITASAGTGGSISPSGSVSVGYGGSRIFTITPGTGYTIDDVLVDGSSVGAVSTYTFTNVVVSHTISVTFNAAAPTVTSIYPSWGWRGSTVLITNLAGTNFVGTPTVQLVRSGDIITATSVNVVSPTRITCRFNIPNGNSWGWYDVVVTNPDGQFGTLDGGFYIFKN